MAPLLLTLLNNHGWYQNHVNIVEQMKIRQLVNSSIVGNRPVMQRIGIILYTVKMLSIYSFDFI